jgi:hypothetical protein
MGWKRSEGGLEIFQLLKLPVVEAVMMEEME